MTILSLVGAASSAASLEYKIVFEMLGMLLLLLLLPPLPLLPSSLQRSRCCRRGSPAVTPTR